MNTPTSWTLTQQARAVASRQVSSRELVAAHLERIAQRNPALNALVLVDAEGALRSADEADAAVSRGETLGPLHGVPFTVKDCLETRGLRTTAGWTGYQDHVPAHDAVVVERVKAAGAVLLGKTNLPSLAADVQCNSALLGVGNHPLDVTRTCGGSTGGGAAAVASEMSPLELGSDHGGSIRIPAAYCGVHAFKPTEHTVPLWGHLHGWPVGVHQARNMVCVGWMGRRVEDLERVMDVVAGPDAREPGVVENAPASTVPARPRLAWTASLDGTAPSRAVNAVLKAWLGSLAADVTEQQPPDWNWGAAWSTWGTLMNAETFQPWMDALQGWLGGAQYGWAQRRRARPAASPLDGARRLRTQLTQRVEDFLSTVDAWVLPVTLTTAFTHRPTGTPISVDGTNVDYWLATGGFTAPLSLTGHPVVVLPAGTAEDGLPVGVQLVGRRGSDRTLLALARQLVTSR